MSDHVSASGSTELSDSVDLSKLSLSESEEESSLPFTSDSESSVANKTVLLLDRLRSPKESDLARKQKVPESHFINKRITGIMGDNKRIIGSPTWHKRIE